MKYVPLPSERVLKMLFLDDEPVRHETFAGCYEGHEIWHAYNLIQFQKALDRCEHFDVVSFDYDLGPNENGHDCAMEMLQRLPFERWPKVAWVHSWNPTGAIHLLETLKRSGIETYRVSWWRTAELT